MTTALERVAIAVAAMAIAIAVIAVLSGGLFTDSPDVTGTAGGPGEPVHTQSELADPQLQRDLTAGDVVLIYGTPGPPPGLTALARGLAPPFSPALAAAGQAVILVRRPRITGVVGLAWDRVIRVQTAGDPRLRAFADFWLGRGAPR